MNEKIISFVLYRKEPDFFCHQDETLESVHGEIKKGIEAATEIMAIELDQDLMRQAEAILAKIGWTLEEACILFLYWCIECPEEVKAWYNASVNPEREEAQGHGRIEN